MLGYLDDLVLIPLGVALVLRMIPPAVMDECRARARSSWRTGAGEPAAAAVIVAIWVGLAALVVLLIVRRWLRRR